MTSAGESRAIAILGMHRSGTSALAGTLRSAGVHFGTVLDQAFALNPTGLQEPAAILYMHEDLLIKNGGCWHEPPEKVSWEPLHDSIRDLFIESRASEPLWGFKDPRSLLVLDGWLKALPHLECVGIMRHPAEVAMSIHRRNEFSLQKSVQIWLEYNQRLLSYSTRLDFPIIEYVNDGEAMQASLRRLMSHLSIPVEEEALSFFKTDYKNYALPEVDLPDAATELYEALRARAV